MSHPLLVESIENRFVPALVYNNRKEDAAKLARFKEPAWNNPVIRFLSAGLEDLVPRRDGVWTTGKVAHRMIESLKAAGQEIPLPLELVQLQHSAKTEWATFAMHCYWEGEVQFGKITGVKQTHAATYRGEEIVNVAFDPGVTDYRTLVETAVRVRCASRIYVRGENQKRLAESVAPGRVRSMPATGMGRVAGRSDQKHYLELSPLRLLPMMEIQQVRVNSALGTRSDPRRFLGQEQRRLLEWILQEYQDGNRFDRLVKAKSEMDFRAYFDFVRIQRTEREKKK